VGGLAPLRGLQAWRRRRAAARAGYDPMRWRRLRGRSWLLSTLDDDEAERLRELTIAFLNRYTIEGVAGFTVDDEVRWTIAAQACVPVLELGLSRYAGWREVVVYPGEFLARHEYVDEHGIAHEEHRELSGEAGPRGPIVLSWVDVERDQSGEFEGNVIVHECAHKLDLLDGDANGRPPLTAGMNPADWARVCEAAFTDIQHYRSRPDDAPVDIYAAEDPGEFFAVISEAFFTHPLSLLDWNPELYRQLRRFYRQDPAPRFHPRPD
jgi:MtfA peptidase